MDYSNTLLNASGRADGTQAVARAASLLREIALCEAGEGSLAELAERLGLSRTSFYWHFTDREAFDVAGLGRFFRVLGVVQPGVA